MGPFNQRNPPSPFDGIPSCDATARAAGGADAVCAGRLDGRVVKSHLGPWPKTPLPAVSDAKDAVYGGVSEQEYVRLRNAAFDAVMGRREALLRSDDVLLRLHALTLRAQVDYRARLHAATDVLRQVPGEPCPWTHGRIAKVSVLLLASFVMVAIGVQSTARILMASGISGFDAPSVAYLFSFVGPGTAIVLKCLSSFFTGDRPRRRFAACVGLVGVLLGFAWVALFVNTFPPAGFDLEALISATTDPGFAAGAETTTALALMFVQLAAEVFLSAALWLETERIFELHKPVGLLPNPAHGATRKSLDAAFAELQGTEELLGEVTGALAEITGLRASYVGGSLVLYRQHSAFASNAAVHLASKGVNSGDAGPVSVAA